MPQQIELRNIALQAAQPLVHGVSLTLQRGRVLALVGSSGSGKSLTCACSNNELYPVIIDPGENRYWVRKIRPLESDDTNFLQKLKEQIPAFLYYAWYDERTSGALSTFLKPLPTACCL